MAYPKPYVNPIGAFIGGAVRAVLGPILAPFMLLAIWIAPVITPWFVRHHYLYRYLGVKASEAENVMVMIVFGAMLLFPPACYLIYKLGQLFLWIITGMSAVLREIHESRGAATFKNKAKTAPKGPLMFETQPGIKAYYPKWNKDSLDL